MRVWLAKRDASHPPPAAACCRPHAPTLSPSPTCSPCARLQVGQPLPAPIPKAELAADHLLLPCAIVRGALAALGLEAAVTADATSLPQVDFTVVLRQQAR